MPKPQKPKQPKRLNKKPKPTPGATPKKLILTKENLRALDQALNDIAREGDTAEGLLNAWLKEE